MSKVDELDGYKEARRHNEKAQQPERFYRRKEARVQAQEYGK